MPDSVDNLELDLGRLQSRGELSPAAQVRRQLRGKHVCPYCGTTRESDVGPCQHCSLEDSPTTRAATRGKLGPWYVLQSRNPSAPGMNFATLMLLVQKGRVTARSVLRGPTTGQFWKHAAKVKGVSREFGLCWNCGGDLSRSARACPSCKRMQEPPLNPDQLLDPGEISSEDLTEQMWAADAASSQVGSPTTVRGGTAGSPIERLVNKGGLRREVAEREAAGREAVGREREEIETDDFVGSESAGLGGGSNVAAPANGGNGHKSGNGKRNGNGHGNGKGGGNGNGNGQKNPPARRAPEPAAAIDDGLAAGMDFSIGFDSQDGLDEDLGPRRRPRGGMLADATEELPSSTHLEMAVFQRGYDSRGGGSAIGKFFKVVFIALILAGGGLGAMCYFDEGIRGKSIGYWEQAKVWVISLTNNKHPNQNRASDSGSAANAEDSAKAAEVSATVNVVDDSPIPGEKPAQRAFRHFEAGNLAEHKGEWAKALKEWDLVKKSGAKAEDLPLGFEARIASAKKKLAEQGR